MSNAHILVVDDEASLQGLLRLGLQKAGYTVSTAGNGQDALAVFSSTAVDLALVDLIMPGMDGFALCAELRKRSDVPILIFASTDNRDNIIRGLSLGADDYLVKPFQMREVIERIEAILRCTGKLKARPVPHK